jgi:hypothetical protein
VKLTILSRPQQGGRTIANRPRLVKPAAVTTPVIAEATKDK